MAQSVYNTAELGETRLKLRDDLEFTLGRHGGMTCYVVEDKVHSRFYRIGIPEYTFLSLLDGRRTMHDALGTTAAALGPDAFSGQDAAAICKWLVECQLAATDASQRADRMWAASEREKRRRRWQWINPLMIRLPLGNPESLLDRLGPWLLWLMTWPVFLGWLLLCVEAARQLAGRWHELPHAGSHLLTPGNWLWLAGSFVVLKVLHELGHALACRRFGGAVREAGLVFILFAPLPYVDVTSSWRFPSKWQRIAVCAAGMYAELLVAAVAAIVWRHAEDPVLRHHMVNLMLLASVTTVLFNVNFLMRFDGYYIVSHWLEIPNLYAQGQQYLRYLGRRYLLGVKAVPPRWPPGRSAIIKLYGAAALAWRIVVCVCLVVAAQALFHGAGLVLAILAVVLWVGVPVVRLAKYLFMGSSREQPSWVRLAGTVLAAGSIVALSFTVIPWPWRIEAPAVIRFAPLTIVRADSPGFVRELFVRPGQEVVAGQPIAQLENRQLDLERQDLQLAISQSRLRSRAHHRGGNLAAYQAENRARAALEDRARQQSELLRRLHIRAPAAGRVMAADTESLLGTYLQSGTEVLRIGDDRCRELVVSISQEEVKAFEDSLDRQVDVEMAGRRIPLTDCRFVRLAPRASTEVPHESLSAAAGGPLSVRPARGRVASPRDQWELVEPRFTGTVAVEPRQSADLKSGQTASVRLNASRGTLGRVLMTRLEQWLRHLAGPAQ